MPKKKYEPIYLAIKHEIETGLYQNGEYLPSENELTVRFDCTRNTVRRALSILSGEGYLLPQHGRGVQVIYQPADKSIFTIGGIESFAEAADRNSLHISTRVLFFQEVIADQGISLETGFDIGAELYYIERIRLFDKDAIIFDTNIFLKSETPGLTREIAGRSIYRYLEEELGMTITTSRRRVTAEPANDNDRQFLALHGQDFVLCVTGQVFNSRGVMFEYTQSRHVPDRVCFAESAVRQKI